MARGSHVDAAFVRALLDEPARARTRGGILWRKGDGTAVVGVVAVEAPGYVRESARLEVRVSPQRPETFFCSYVADGGFLRRLCVNKPRGEGLIHKHRAEIVGPGECYTPTDIPFVPRLPNVSTSVYLEVLRAFANECRIEVGDDFVWTPPWKEVR